MKSARFLVPVLALAALAASSPALASPAPDLPEIRRTATLDMSGNGWTGRLVVGLSTAGSGVARSTRPMPLQLEMQRQVCDIAGCVVTTITAAPGALAMPRLAAQFTSVALDSQVIGVVVRRSAPGGPVMEHAAVLTVSLRARRTAAVSRETVLRQESSGETLTISLSAPLSGTVLVGDDTLAAIGTAVKASVVG